MLSHSSSATSTGKTPGLTFGYSPDQRPKTMPVETKWLKRGSSIVRLSSALESWGHRSWQCVCGYLFLRGLAFHTCKQTVGSLKTELRKTPFEGEDFQKTLLYCWHHLLFWQLYLQCNGGLMAEITIIVRVLTSRAGLFTCLDKYTFPLPLYRGGKVTNGVFLHFINFIFPYSLHSNRSLTLRACIAPLLVWHALNVAWQPAHAAACVF